MLGCGAWSCVAQFPGRPSGISRKSIEDDVRQPQSQAAVSGLHGNSVSQKEPQQVPPSLSTWQESPSILQGEPCQWQPPLPQQQQLRSLSDCLPEDMCMPTSQPESGEHPTESETHCKLGAHDHGSDSEEEEEASAMQGMSPEAHPRSPPQFPIAVTPATTTTTVFEPMPSSAPAASYMEAVHTLMSTPPAASNPTEKHAGRAHESPTPTPALRPPGQHHTATHAAAHTAAHTATHTAMPPHEAAAHCHPHTATPVHTAQHWPVSPAHDQCTLKARAPRSPRATAALSRPALSVQLPQALPQPQPHCEASDSLASPMLLSEGSSPAGAPPLSSQHSLEAPLPHCTHSHYTHSPSPTHSTTPSPPLPPSSHSSPFSREKWASKSQQDRERVHFAHELSLCAGGCATPRAGPSRSPSFHHPHPQSPHHPRSPQQASPFTTTPSPPPGTIAAANGGSRTLHHAASCAGSTSGAAAAAAIAARTRRALPRTRSALSLCPTSAMGSAPSHGVDTSSSTSGSHAVHHMELAKSASAEAGVLPESALKSALVGCSPPSNDSGLATVRHVLQLSQSYSMQGPCSRTRMQPTPPQGGSAQQGVRQSGSFSKPGRSSMEFGPGAGHIGMQQVLNATRNAIRHCNTATHSRDGSRRSSLSRALAREHRQPCSPGSGGCSPVASGSTWVLGGTSPKQQSFMQQGPPSVLASTSPKQHSFMQQGPPSAVGTLHSQHHQQGPHTVLAGTSPKQHSLMQQGPPTAIGTLHHHQHYLQSAPSVHARGTSSSTPFHRAHAAHSSHSAHSAHSMHDSAHDSSAASTASTPQPLPSLQRAGPNSSAATSGTAHACAEEGAALPQPAPWVMLQGPPSAPPALGALRLRAGSAARSGSAAASGGGGAAVGGTASAALPSAVGGTGAAGAGAPVLTGPAAVGGAAGKSGPAMSMCGPGSRGDHGAAGGVGGGARGGVLLGPSASSPALYSSSSTLGMAAGANSSMEAFRALSREELEHEL